MDQPANYTFTLNGGEKLIVPTLAVYGYPGPVNTSSIVTRNAVKSFLFS